jgi:hypothetical protein
MQGGSCDEGCRIEACRIEAGLCQCRRGARHRNTYCPCEGCARADRDAGVLTRVDVLEVVPFADGAALGAAGPYERLSGIAYGELDPAAARHRGIVNLDRCALNARGQVEYDFDWCVLRPVDAGRRSGCVLLDITNRGRKFLLSWLMAAPANQQPLSARDAGDALFLRRAHTIVWSGWDAAPPERNQGMSLRVPRAAGVRGTVRDEWVFGSRDTNGDLAQLSYAAASLDPALASLTVRKQQHDTRVPLAAGDWRYENERQIRLTNGHPQIGSLYEFHYPAADPAVLGIGFAAVRDLGSLLHHGAVAQGAPVDGGPLDGAATPPAALLAIGISQAGRFLRDFLRGGWNADEQGRKVFDGLLVHVAGSGGVFLNHAFGQPVRTATQHADHDFPEHRFPFSVAPASDPASGAIASLMHNDGTDPLWMEVNTSTEYWQKAAALVHVDPLATYDLCLPDNARAWLVAGTQHSGAVGRGVAPGMCVHATNSHDPAPLLRALLVALEAWVRDGTAPPDSRLPALADLREPAALGFPQWPGVHAPRVANTVVLEADWVFPVNAATACRVLVPRVNDDGNEIDGVLLPDIAVPLGTHTGWNMYQAPYADGALADRFGSFLPFARTAAERAARADPRLSLLERYHDGELYLARVRAVVSALLAARLLLDEDAQAILARAPLVWQRAMETSVD